MLLKKTHSVRNADQHIKFIEKHIECVESSLEGRLLAADLPLTSSGCGGSGPGSDL